jgi:hypothetical protein
MRWLPAIGICATAGAQSSNTPVSLVWITNSSVKLEQIIGDYDWEALAQGSNLLTASQTVSRFHILGNGLGYSFEDKGKLIFLFGDTISENQTNWNYHAADPLAWSTATDGEAALVLNFFTNSPGTNTPMFVQATGIKMGPFDVPNSGIGLSNGVFIVCNTGSDSNLANPQTNDYSVLVTFNETNLFSSGTFVTNRIISSLNTNLDGRSPWQGHFINVSMHEYGTNVMMFGTGEYRSGDIFLCTTPTANFANGTGTLYFAGITNGQPSWSTAESNCVPVVQDNPTNGPAWPNDSGTAGNVSVCHPAAAGLWLMTYDGGRSGETRKNKTTGVYFSYAPQPWGPWSTPHLIFNKARDNGAGVFIHDPGLSYDDGLDGPVIGTNSPTATPGGDFAPIMIERFTRVTNSILYIYYTMSTWNPYTVVKMRSAFSIIPQIDAGTLVYKRNKFSFAWSAPTNESYQVEYTDSLPPSWTTFTNVITSTNGTFSFTNDESNGSGLPPSRSYRVRTGP